jgi:hypothetical protein
VDAVAEEGRLEPGDVGDDRVGEPGLGGQDGGRVESKPFLEFGVGGDEGALGSGQRRLERMEDRELRRVDEREDVGQGRSRGLRHRVDDAGEDVALDELLLPARGLTEGRGGQPVDVTQGAGRGLVQHGDGVGAEELSLAADALQADAQVLGGVLGERGSTRSRVCSRE